MNLLATGVRSLYAALLFELFFRRVQLTFIVCKAVWCQAFTCARYADFDFASSHHHPDQVLEAQCTGTPRAVPFGRISTAQEFISVDDFGDPTLHTSTILSLPQQSSKVNVYPQF